MDSCFEGDVFVLRDYNQKPPFSSLLPGVAGPQGVPLWCFYVSRGQCVASFGADERDGAMMEYVPAAAAYEDTARKGFRTFISCGGAAARRGEGNRKALRRPERWRALAGAARVRAYEL